MGWRTYEPIKAGIALLPYLSSSPCDRVAMDARQRENSPDLPKGSQAGVEAISAIPHPRGTQQYSAWRPPCLREGQISKPLAIATGATGASGSRCNNTACTEW